MESNFQKSFKNISLTMLCSTCSLFLSFISRSVFIHWLSSEYLGISGLFSNILTILSLAELGIGNVMLYSLYEPLKKNNVDKINALLNLYKKAYRYIALSIFIVGLLISPFVQVLIKEPPNIKEDLRFLFILYLINTSASYLCAYKKSMLLADQKSYIANIASSISQIIMMLTQCGVLILTRSYVLFLICQIVFTILLNLVLTAIVNRQYSCLFKKNYIPLTKGEIQSIFLNIKALAISRICGIVSTGTDNVIISKLFGLTPVGLVANYNLIINSVNNIVYSGLTSITSGIGHFNVESTVEEKRKIFNELFLAVYLIYSFICVCLAVLIQPFITLWIGDSFLLDFSTVLSLVFIVYVGGMNYPIYVFRTTKGYFKEVQYIYILSAITNIVLSIVLGIRLGVLGVFTATWLSKLILPEVWDSYYTYKKILEKKHSLYFIRYAIFLGVLAINFALCKLAVSLIPNPGVLGFTFKCLICILVNIVFNIIIFFKTKEFKTLFIRMTQLICFRKQKGGCINE